MIKGIEIILIYRKASPRMVSMLSLVGEKLQIFQMWEIFCEPPKVRVGHCGVMIFAIASATFTIVLHPEKF